MNSFEQFALDFLNEVRAEATAEEEFIERVFFEQATGIMVDAGACMNPVPCYHKQRGAQVSGFDFLDDSDGLDLFITIFSNENNIQAVSQTDIQTYFNRLKGFFEKSCKGMAKSLEESAEVWDLSDSIFHSRNNIKRVNLFILTNGLVRAPKVSDEEIDGIEFTHHVWDIERLHQVASANQKPESLNIDFFSEYKVDIPCLPMHNGNEVYQSYLAIIPGEILFQIYGKYGQRLLEKNVRVFLQARQKVNAGILRTLRNEPHMFLAYNNGITATAESIDIEYRNGIPYISNVRDFQIVNGGQTTASIYNAGSRYKADLSQVAVQMKLTLIKDLSQKEEVVPQISFYANSQTKVNASDFSANDPFHLALERLSRNIWVPNPSGKATSKWFYERSRGSHVDELSRQKTEAQKKKFKVLFPTSQRINKTQAAKFEMSWLQYPHFVSLGAEKNFSKFMDRITIGRKFTPGEVDFKRLVAKAILFKQCDLIARRDEMITGYKANVVSYSIALLSHYSSQRVNLDKIWEEQSISEALSESLSKIIRVVWNHITAPPREGMNVTEWCKKEQCWENLKEREHHFHLPEEDLIQEGGKITQSGMEMVVKDSGQAISHEEEIVVEEMKKIPSETWFTLSGWAKQTGNFQSRERSFLFQMGKITSNNWRLSFKQAKWAKKIYEEAIRLGFKIPE